MPPSKAIWARSFEVRVSYCEDLNLSLGPLVQVPLNPARVLAGSV